MNSLPNPFISALEAAMPAETAAAPRLTDPEVAAAEIPADKQRHPPGCPDADWCRGNRACYWDCKASPDEAIASRFVLDEDRFLEEIEPPPLFLQAPVEVLQVLSRY